MIKTEEVIDFICEYEGFEKKEVSLDTNLVLDLGLSSLELFDLMNALENAFELGNVKNSNISDVHTISDVIDLINEIKN